MKNIILRFLRAFFTLENPTVNQIAPGVWEANLGSKQLADIVEPYVEQIQLYFNSVGLDVKAEIEGHRLLISETNKKDVNERREQQTEFQQNYIEQRLYRGPERWQVGPTVTSPMYASASGDNWMPESLQQYFKDQGLLGPTITQGVQEFLALPETPSLFQEMPERLIQNNKFKRFLRKKINAYPVAGQFTVTYDLASESAVVDIMVNNEKQFRFFLHPGKVQPLQEQFADIFRNLFNTCLLDYLAPTIERSLEDPINITIYSPLTKNPSSLNLAKSAGILDKAIIQITHGRQILTLVEGKRDDAKIANLALPELDKFGSDLHKFLTSNQFKKVDIEEAIVRVKCKTRTDVEKLKGLLQLIDAHKSEMLGNSLLFYKPKVDIAELFQGLDVEVENLRIVPKKMLLDIENWTADQKALMTARNNKQKFIQKVPGFTQGEISRFFREQGKATQANLIETIRTPLGAFHSVTAINGVNVVQFVLFRDSKNNISYMQWNRDRMLLRAFMVKAQETVNFVKNSLGTDSYLDSKKLIYIDGDLGLGVYRRQAVIVESEQANEVGQVLQFMGKFDEKGIYPDVLWTKA